MGTANQTQPRLGWTPDEIRLGSSPPTPVEWLRKGTSLWVSNSGQLSPGEDHADVLLAFQKELRSRRRKDSWAQAGAVLWQGICLQSAAPIECLVKALS